MSIKASVGLKVRFDKMHVYSADMEAARREAPADIEWPEWSSTCHSDRQGGGLRAEAVDTTVFAAIEWVLAVSVDPSTYDTDTNPVATAFVADLLHSPDETDPMAAEPATLSEDAMASANSDNNTPNPGFFDSQLESVLGRGSFNATPSARPYDHFLNDPRGSAGYAAVVSEAWGAFMRLLLPTSAMRTPA
eukprot:jgi/Tetstr1/455685/TSEL_042493.t1